MNKLLVGLVTLLLFPFGQAFSATEIEFVNERTEDGETTVYTVKALHQNGKSRYRFHDPDDVDTSKNSYLLSLEDENITYYIDEKDNTCHQWDNDEFVQTLNEFLHKTAGRFKIKASDQKVSKVFEKPGDVMLGFETKHMRIKLSFTASYKYLLFKDKYRIERLVDIWMAPGIGKIDPTPIFRATWERTGNDELDQKMKNIIGENANYFIVRAEFQQTSTDKKGKQIEVHSKQFIESISEIDDLADGTFQVPACRKVDADQMEKKFKALLKDLIS